MLKLFITKDGEMSIDVVELKKSLDNTFLNSIELGKKKKRSMGLPQTCDKCNNVYKGKIGLGIHKKHAHPTL